MQSSEVPASGRTEASGSMKIIHTADWHFEEARHRRIAADGIDQGWHDVAGCLREIVDHAIASAATEPTVLFFGGDLAKSRKPSPQTYAFVGEQFGRLHADGVPIVCLPGNHDLASSGEANALDPLAHLPGVHLYNEPGIAYIGGTDAAIVTHGQHPTTAAAIVCVPWLQRSVAAANLPSDTPLEVVLDTMSTAALAVIRELTAAPLAAGIPTFIGYHGTVLGGRTATGQAAHLFHEPVLSAVDLGNLGVAGVMLGHLHKRQDIGSSVVGAPPIVYSSSVERLTFGDESDEKGGVAWTVPSSIGQAAEYSWIDTNARPFVTVTEPPVGIWAFQDAIVRVRLADVGEEFEPAAMERLLLDAGAHKVTEVVVDTGDQRVEHAAADLARTDPLEALAEWIAVEHPDITAEERALLMDDASRLLGLAPEHDFKGGEDDATQPVTPAVTGVVAGEADGAPATADVDPHVLTLTA